MVIPFHGTTEPCTGHSLTTFRTRFWREMRPEGVFSCLQRCLQGVPSTVRGGCLTRVKAIANRISIYRMLTQLAWSTPEDWRYLGRNTTRWCSLSFAIRDFAKHGKIQGVRMIYMTCLWYHLPSASLLRRTKIELVLLPEDVQGAATLELVAKSGWSLKIWIAPCNSVVSLSRSFRCSFARSNQRLRLSFAHKFFVDH